MCLLLEAYFMLTAWQLQHLQRRGSDLGFAPEPSSEWNPFEATPKMYELCINMWYFHFEGDRGIYVKFTSAPNKKIQMHKHHTCRKHANNTQYHKYGLDE